MGHGVWGREAERLRGKGKGEGQTEKRQGEKGKSPVVRALATNLDCGTVHRAVAAGHRPVAPCEENTFRSLLPAPRQPSEEGWMKDEPSLYPVSCVIFLVAVSLALAKLQLASLYLFHLRCLQQTRSRRGAENARDFMSWHCCAVLGQSAKRFIFAGTYASPQKGARCSAGLQDVLPLPADGGKNGELGFLGGWEEVWTVQKTNHSVLLIGLPLSSAGRSCRHGCRTAPESSYHHPPKAAGAGSVLRRLTTFSRLFRRHFRDGKRHSFLGIFWGRSGPAKTQKKERH